MKRKNILYDGGSLWSLKNATGIHILEIIENLSENNHIILLSHHLDILSMKHNENITVEFIRTFSKSFIKHLTYDLISLLVLLIKYPKGKIDVLYSRNRTGFALIFYSKLLNIPLFLEINGILKQETKTRNESFFKVFYMTRIMEPLNFKNAKKLIAVSNSVKKGLINQYNINSNKITVIENGANTELFKPMPKKYEMLKEHDSKLNDSFNYIGFIGSFTKWHGLESLVKSIPYVIKENKRTRFIFVGDGPNKNHIKELVDTLKIKKYVIFTGQIPYSDVPDYINLFDVGVILKIKNVPGSPLKLWEYLSSGKPVIASKTEDFKIIQKNKLGILVDPNNPKEIANAIINLLENDDLRCEMGKEAINYVKNSHTWKYVSDELDELFKIVINEFKC